MPLGLNPGYLFVLLALFAPFVVGTIVFAWFVRGDLTPPAITYGLRSPDGRWWWDGSRWQPMPPDQQP